MLFLQTKEEPPKLSADHPNQTGAENPKRKSKQRADRQTARNNKEFAPYLNEKQLNDNLTVKSNSLIYGAIMKSEQGQQLKGG